MGGVLGGDSHTKGGRIDDHPLCEWVGVMNYQHGRHMPRKSSYKPPRESDRLELNEALRIGGRPELVGKQLDMLRSSAAGEVTIFYAGDASLFRRPAVSIVGTREVSSEGRARARKLAREISEASVVVMSGLAKGVDAAAHGSTIEAGGSTIAVIGTPIDKAYPAENADLQQQIYAEHLLVSPFAVGEQTHRSSFPKRNRVMAALSDATVIVEASDTSGTLHQAAECGRLRRWLFILQSVVDNSALSWPAKFVDQDYVRVLRKTSDIVDAIGPAGDRRP